MRRRSCPHCVMPLRPFTAKCPRCERPTPFAQSLPYVAAVAAAGVALVVFVALAAVRLGEATGPTTPVADSALTLSPPITPRGVDSLIAAGQAEPGPEPAGGDSVPLPPTPVWSDTGLTQSLPPGLVPDRRGIEVVTTPPDPFALYGNTPGAVRRSVMESLLRRGLVDSLRERSARVVQVFVGRAFFRQPPQFRDPLIKALDSAWTDASGPRAFELWWDTFPLGDYARDTFRFGKWYYEFR